MKTLIYIPTDEEKEKILQTSDEIISLIASKKLNIAQSATLLKSLVISFKQVHGVDICSAVIQHLKNEP